MDFDHQLEYEMFIKAMDSGSPIPVESVGKLIVKLAAAFSDAIGDAVNTEYRYNQILAQFESKIDDNGKPLSSTKAEAQARATPEYKAYISAKGEVTALEQKINACKSLQRSLQNDYNYSGMQ